ncbi:MAG: hypothetical protein LBF51_07265 [Zoogloeaceae bacterium]|jgi:uncharacterized protein with gpF-like domain|nr:hypothetical protein [Zoogloeaceae bacterium]
MAITLSKAKGEWASRWKPAALKGTTLLPSAKTGERFRNEIALLTEKMIRTVERDVLALFRSPAARAVMDADGGARKPLTRTTGSIASQSRIQINRLAETFARLFERRAKRIAEAMVSGMAKSSQTALTASLSKATGVGLAISLQSGARQEIVKAMQSGALHEIVKASAEEAASLIRRIPQDYIGRVRESLLRSITHAGEPSLFETLEAEVKEHGIKVRNWAYNTARDQTNKAFTNLTRERMKSAGVDTFEWIHSGGGSKPREYHLKDAKDGGLNHGVFSIADPPVIDERTGERGMPGQLPNCRCKFRPIIDLDDV